MPVNLGHIRADDIVIAFMGPTGSGKSFFIDLLTGRPGQHAKNSLESMMQGIETSRTPYPNDEKGRDIVFVDFPGFDDDRRSDMQILYLISNWLKMIYKNGVKLNGLVYLQSIRSNRMAGTLYKSLCMFGELCDDAVLNQVAFVTTMWQRVDKRVGEKRERDIIKDPWRVFIDKGSSVDRLREATFPEAWRIVTTLLKKWKERKVVLQLQKELVDKKIALNETYAGQALYTDLQGKLHEQKERMKALMTFLTESGNPELKEALQHEYEELQQDFDRTFEEANVLKVSLFRRLSRLFLSAYDILDDGKLQCNAARLRSLLPTPERVRAILPTVTTATAHNGSEALVDKLLSHPPIPVLEKWDLREIQRVEPVNVENLDEDDIILAVMGPTGAGKSTFIQTITGDHNGVGHQLQSATSKVCALRITFTGSSGANLVLVDTPGFDDTYKSDYEILETIAQWLTSVKKKPSSGHWVLRISGILYLHRITDTRIPGSVKKNFSVFQKLCGEDFYDRVILTTTMWPTRKSETDEDSRRDEEECKEHEQELKKKFWRDMIDKGSRVYRFALDLGSAQVMINAVIEQENKKRSQDFVQIQKEILEQLKSIPNTQAGMHLHSMIGDVVERQSCLLDELEHEMGLSVDQDPEVIKRLLNELKGLRQERERALEDMQKLRPKTHKR